MKKLRTAVAVVTLVLLTAGYAVSQIAALQGWAADYALRVDSPPVQRLAMALFLAIVALGFIPDRDPISHERAEEKAP
jgi:hypothetical protein